MSNSKSTQMENTKLGIELPLRFKQKPCDATCTVEARNLVVLRHALVSIVTHYDQKQAKKAHWNPYALPQYFKRIDAIMADIERGADIRRALLRAFNDRFLSYILKSLGLPDFTQEELDKEKESSWVYTPVTPEKETKN